MMFKLLLLTCLLYQVQSLKVLMYATTLAQSHLKHAGSLIEALVEKGHTVDFLIQNWNTRVSINGTDKARNVFRVEVADSPWMKMPHITNAVGAPSVSYFDINFLKTPEAFCEALISNEALLEKLKGEDYDIMLSGCYDSCGFGLAHLLGIRAVSGYTATPIAYKIALALGVPVHPAYISDEFAPTGTGDHMSFWDRWENFKFLAYTWFYHKELFRREQQVFERRYPNFPPIESLMRKMTYMFVNTNEIIDLPRPVSGKIQYIGGIALHKAKPLDKYYDSLMSARPKGAILFSFGSNARSSMLSEQVRRDILKAFAKFPEYTFIWKYDDDDQLKEEIVANYTNVQTSKWVPQTDLLHDNRMKLFISHMGLNSFIETSYAGVPLVSIPLYGDQEYNTECAIQNGVTIKINKWNITTENVYNAVNTMLSNPMYALKSKEISEILASRLEDPKTNFVQRVEMAAKYPHLTDFLHLRASEIDFFTYFLLDIVALVFASTVGGILAVFVGLRILARTLNPNKLKNE